MVDPPQNQPIKPISKIYYDPTDPVTGLDAKAGTVLGEIWIDAKGKDLGSGHGQVILDFRVKQTIAKFGSRNFGQDVANVGCLVINQKIIGAFQAVSNKEAVSNPVLFSENGQTCGTSTQKGTIWFLQLGNAGYNSQTFQKRKWDSKGKFVGQTGINFVYDYTWSYKTENSKVTDPLKFSVTQVFALVNSEGQVGAQYTGYGNFFDRIPGKPYFYNEWVKLRNKLNSGS